MSKQNAVSEAVNANEAVSVRGLLETFVSGTVKVSEEQSKLQEKRTGTYTNGVQAAIVAGDPETFEKEVQAFMDDIRANKESYARNLGCKVAKRQPKGQPKNRPVYVVPSSVMALKSYMLSALKFEVPLQDDEGQPRGYSAIRSDVNAVKAEQKKAALQGDDKVRVEIQDTLDAIESRLDKITGDNLTALQGQLAVALESARKASGIDAQRAAKKEAKAEAAKKATKKTAKKKASKKSGNADLAAAA